MLRGQNWGSTVENSKIQSYQCHIPCWGLEYSNYWAARFKRRPSWFILKRRPLLETPILEEWILMTIWWTILHRLKRKYTADPMAIDPESIPFFEQCFPRGSEEYGVVIHEPSRHILKVPFWWIHLSNRERSETSVTSVRVLWSRNGQGTPTSLL